MAGNGSPKTGGRKKGTPNKATADIKAAFQKHGMKFVTAMVELTKHKDPHIQLKALQICLDRGYGRPPLAVAIGGDPDAPPISHRNPLISAAHYDQLMGSLPPAKDPVEEA